MAACVLPVFAGAQERVPSATDPAADLALEEVTVMARRREESIQSVPLSVTALSQDALDQNHVVSITDLQRLVPSMTLYGPVSQVMFVSIRGQGGYSPGASPGVGTYFNEVPLPAHPVNGGALGGAGLYYDLESLQVLKGPQGTLFGRNTTGGALLLQSKRPTEEFGGYLQAASGNYNDREATAAINMPIVEGKLLARFAGNFGQRDGFTKVLVAPGFRNGRRVDDRDFLAGRLTLSFLPSDSVRNDLIVDTLESDTNGNSSILVYVPSATQPGGSINSSFPDLAGLISQQQALGIRQQIGASSNAVGMERRFAVADLLRVEFADALAFRNIFGYARAKSLYAGDLDGTALRVYDGTAFDGHASAGLPDEVEQWSEEAQLQGTSLAGSLDWTAGVFYLDRPLGPFNLNRSTIRGAAPGSDSLRSSERSTAIYLQGSHDLSAIATGLRATTGGRYTWDKRYAETRVFNAAGACALTPAIAGSNCTATGELKTDTPTWLLGLEFQAAPATLLYAKASRGYRTGGINLRLTTPDNRTFDPEFVTEYEAGIKADWRVAGMPVRTNAAVFYQDYGDIQRSVTAIEQGRPATAVLNPANARLWGTEFEATLQATEHLHVGAYLNTLDFKYTSFKPGYSAAAVTASINTLNMPKLKYGISGEYRLPLGQANGDVLFSARWSWQDDTFVGPPDPFDTQAAYGLLNLGIDWTGMLGTRIDASVFLDNATDKEYVVGGYQISNSLGFSTVNYGAPRTYGLRLRYEFGAAE